MVAGLAFRNLYREGAPSLHAILLTADVFGVTYPPGTRLCSSPFADRVGRCSRSRGPLLYSGASPTSDTPDALLRHRINESMERS